MPLAIQYPHANSLHFLGQPKMASSQPGSTAENKVSVSTPTSKASLGQPADAFARCTDIPLKTATANPDRPYAEFPGPISQARLHAAELTRPQIEAITGLGIVQDVLPHAIAGTAGIAASIHPYTFKSLNLICSLTADLTMKRIEPETFKNRTQDIAHSFNAWVEEQSVRFKHDKAAQPHLLFLDQVAQSLTQLSNTIEHQTGEACLTAAIAFQNQLSRKINRHITTYGNAQDKTRLANMQNFLKVYHQNLLQLPGNFSQLNEKARMKLAPLSIQVPGTKTRDLLEWTKSHPA